MEITSLDIEQETNLTYEGKTVYCIYKTFTNMKVNSTYTITPATRVIGFGGSGSLGSPNFQGPYDVQSKNVYGNSWSFYISSDGNLKMGYNGSTDNWNGGKCTVWILYTKD